MFSEPRKNLVASDEGYSVEVLGRTGLLYTDGSRSAWIDSEVLMGEPALIVFLDRLEVWRRSAVQVTPAERELIASRLVEAFLWKNHSIVVKK